MSRTRARSQGRRGGEVERFAKIPCDVLRCEAVCTLDHAAFKVLVVLACGCWHKEGKGNNGALALTPTYAAPFGLKSRDTIYGSLRELERRRLVIKTREGWRRHKHHFALFALPWVDIHNREGQPLEQPESCKPYYRALLDWSGSVPASGTQAISDAAQISTAQRDQSVPASGTQVPISVPASELDGPVSVPPTGNTLRILAGAHARPRRAGRVAPTAQARGQAVTATDIAALRFLDVVAVARKNPSITVDDLKARARCSEADAHRALQQLQAEVRT